MLIAGAIAVVFYVVTFSWIQHERGAKGPWEIDFMTDANGKPALMLLEPNLNISEKLTFPKDKLSETNLFRAIRFAEPTTNLPFGEMIFQDATFLPGTVTLRTFGHEIELLPRVLIIDKREYPWHSGDEITVHK